MINNVIVFYGSKKEFENTLSSRISVDDDTIVYMELIQHYNARLRPNESGVRESALSQNIEVDNCIVRAEDYGSVLEHALSNFVTIVSLNHDIDNLYVHNPPKRVIRSLESAYSNNIEYIYQPYKGITRENLKDIYKNINSDILGQDNCKKDIISGLYRLMSNSSDRPAVLMLYGPSGVGKTETAKSISKTLGGELLRVQFSMMQTSESYNYVFGAEHSKGSFARDMMARESNVILIDEFDKVNSVFYNAFYELFDEGRYVDSNYEVDLRKTIFICTCNFNNEDEIKRQLGPAMFSRIGCCIEYSELGIEEKWQIIETWYHEILNHIAEDEKEKIKNTDILSWFKENANRYDNIRILKTKMENAIFAELTEIFIISDSYIS
jgi:ATP-dependent Clp protease ATP-binding subunit ClpA